MAAGNKCVPHDYFNAYACSQLDASGNGRDDQFFVGPPEGVKYSSHKKTGNTNTC